MSEKPECQLIGENGNIFNLMGKARKTLKRANQPGKAEELSRRVMSEATSYDQALSIIMEYVEVV